MAILLRNVALSLLLIFAVGAQPVPLLSEAGLCPSPGGAPRRVLDPGFHPSHIPKGNDLVKVELSSPEAVCNDGSPAILYVRPAASGSRDPDGVVDDRWVIHLQEGGACGAYEDCLERWCGTGFYDASKMSSRFAPETMGGQGLFLRDEDNVFGDYNQVYVYYCSSDGWTGRKLDSVVESGDSEGSPYRLHFKGSHIVDAVFEELRGGLQDSQGRQLLPDIDQATRILFTGSSAGSSGVRHNADRVGEMLRTRNPDLEFMAVTDGGFYARGPARLGTPEEGYEQALRANYETVTVGLRDGLLDESCLEANVDKPWLCVDATFVQLNHITTPMVARQDLLDNNPLDNVVPEPFPTPAVWAQLNHDLATQLTTLRQTAAEAVGMTRDPAVYSPLCGIHITLDARSFYAQQVRGPDGRPISFYEVLRNSVFGGGPTVALTDRPPDSPPAPSYSSLCRPRPGEPSAGPQLTMVSSASYALGRPVAVASIASVFGSGLAPDVAVATSVPLPQRLLGSAVLIRDSAGTRRLCRLIAVTPGQINFLVPPDLSPGPAQVAVVNEDGSQTLGEVNLSPIAPGLYSARSSGEGVAAAFLLRVGKDGRRVQELVYDPATLEPIPIDLGREGEDVYLLLFGTGFRNGSSVSATVDGVNTPVLGFAAHGTFEGLDQANIGPLSPALTGRGAVEIVLTVDDRPSNAVSVTIR